MTDGNTAIDYEHCANCNKTFEEDEQGMFHVFHNKFGVFCIPCGEANPTLKYGCSEKLLSLINEFVDSGIKFTEMIGKVWEQGLSEGLSMQEIGEIIRPFVRERGLTKHQVYYLTHMPEQQEKSRQQYEKLIEQREAESRNIPTVIPEDDAANEERIFHKHAGIHRFYLICKSLTEEWINKNIPERLLNEKSKDNRVKITKMGKEFGERMVVDVHCLAEGMKKVSEEYKKDPLDYDVLQKFYNKWMDELFAEMMLSRLQILDWFEKDAMKEMIEYYENHPNPISEEQTPDLTNASKASKLS